MGLTAGNGRLGAGEADLRNDGEEPKDERLLCVRAGGSIGIAVVAGVPGVDGAGEAIAKFAPREGGRGKFSGGAGLLEDIRLPGRSILLNFPYRVQVPSFNFRE